MATQGSHTEQEIITIISAIKKTVNETFRMNSSAVELIHNHLERLKDYLESLDNVEDLMSTVNDFIGSTSHLLGIIINPLQIKLTLKAHILKLEEALHSFQQDTDCYRQLLFVPGLSFRHSDQK